MPLTADQELIEHELRVAQMQINITKMATDMRMEERKLARQTYSIIAQVIGVFIAGVGVGIGLLSFFGHR